MTLNERVWFNKHINIIELLLVVIIVLLCLGCTHTGTVVFKGYSPAMYEVGYKPSHSKTGGITKGFVYHDSYNYVIIKTEQGKYEEIEISRDEAVDEGDTITKHTLYYKDVLETQVKMIKELNK